MHPRLVPLRAPGRRQDDARVRHLPGHHGTQARRSGDPPRARATPVRRRLDARLHRALRPQPAAGLGQQELRRALRQEARGARGSAASSISSARPPSGVIDPLCARVLAGETIQTELEIPYAGGPRFVHMSASPTLDAAGVPDGCVTVLTDVTHWRRLEQERERALNELREADRRKDEFLAMLSHELRNPLAPILNSVEVLERLGPGRARARGHVHDGHRPPGAAHEAPARRPPRRVAREPGQDPTADASAWI